MSWLKLPNLLGDGGFAKSAKFSQVSPPKIPLPSPLFLSVVGSLAWWFGLLFSFGSVAWVVGCRQRGRSCSPVASGGGPVPRRFNGVVLLYVFSLGLVILTGIVVWLLSGLAILY